MVHGSLPNHSSERRIGLFFDYFAAESIHAGQRESARLVHGVDNASHYDLEPAPTEDYGPTEIATHQLAVEKLSANFYSEWEGQPEALSGKARNRV